MRVDANERAYLIVFCTLLYFLKSSEAYFLNYHAAYHPFQFLNPFTDIHETWHEHEPTAGNLNAVFVIS